VNRRRDRPRWRRVDGIVLLDKPWGLSSNDALQRVKKLFNAERAGHTGSLDPLATGLLPICLGEATKLCGILLDGDKHYHADVVLGVGMTTGDGEGQERARSDASQVTREDIERVLPQFRGPLSQIPPMYSALKQQGQALYKLARSGLEVERLPRNVHIHKLEILSYEPGRLELDVICSKGTYIRTLAEDLAAAFGQQAHLGGLRRVGAVPFDAGVKMMNFEILQQAADQGLAMIDELLLPAISGLSHWPQWQASEEQLPLLAGGRRFKVSGLQPGKLAVVDAQNRLCGMANVGADGLIAPERWLLPE
jgi:tRNA pseudouridine55 synthase